MKKNRNFTNLSFIPLHFSDKLGIINREGITGVVTLWSRIDWVKDMLREAGIDLSEETSPIAVIGNLYGNGLPELLRNLLYNPQINTIIICGKDRSNSSEELTNFFLKGLETVEFLSEKKNRIIGTNRIIDDMVTPGMFLKKPVIFHAGDLKTEESKKKLQEFINSLRYTDNRLQERIEIPLPTVKVKMFPSNPRNHNILAKNQLDAWIELIFRLHRFGNLVHLRKGDRQELQNVKVIVEEPSWIEDDKLQKFGFKPDEFKNYYDTFLNTTLPPDTSYTYGNRIGEWFNRDTVNDCIDNLNKDPEDRKSFISLWDSGKDISSSSGHPCLVSLFFRKFDNKLTLTTIFRTHNSLDAWLKNFYGLMKVRDKVCERTGMKPGAITVISQSISIDTRRIDVAKSIASQKRFALKEDPNGNFNIELQNEEIVINHYYNGVLINTYRGKNPMKLQHQLARDNAVSDVSHAVYLGRMLERAFNCLQRGEEFIQG